MKFAFLTAPMTDWSRPNRGKIGHGGVSHGANDEYFVRLMRDGRKYPVEQVPTDTRMNRRIGCPVWQRQAVRL